MFGLKLLAWWQNLKSALEIGLGIILCYHMEIIFPWPIRVSGLRKTWFPLPHNAFFIL